MTFDKTYKIVGIFGLKRMKSSVFPDKNFRVWSQVEMPDRKSICPDRPRRKVSMSRPSQTESAYVQTFVRSKFLVRSSCVQNSLCPDFRAFKILYDQTLVRSKLKFVRSFVRSKTPMSRLSCVQKHSCPDFRVIKNAYVQTFVRSCSDNVFIMYSFQV